MPLIQNGGNVQETQFGREYYVERAEKNRQLAASAADPSIRALHLRYVAMYEALVEDMDEALA